MHALIERHRLDISDVCRRFGVRRLDVFGSAARSIDFDVASSDVDFLVEFGPNRTRSALYQFFGLSEALEQLLGRSVDLVEASAIKNPFLLADIAKAREPVYAS